MEHRRSRCRQCSLWCLLQSQVNEEGEGDSRMFNFCRTPRQRGVDTVKRIDSKGHLCGVLLHAFKRRNCCLLRASSYMLTHACVPQPKPQTCGCALEGLRRGSMTLTFTIVHAGLMFKSVSGQDLVQSALSTAPDVY